MEEKLNVSKELEKLEAKMGKVMADSAQDEIGETKREINKLSMQIEELLVHDAGFPQNIASTLVQNMHDKLTYETGKNIASSRTNEYEESKYNLSTVEQDTPKGTADKLESFSQDGVAINNRRYNQNLEQIMEEVFREYKMRLSRVNDRRVDEAVYDIRKLTDKTLHRMQEMHEDFSKDIVKTVAKEAEALGVNINEDLLDKMDKEVVRLAQEHGLIDKEPENEYAQVDKAAKNFNDFASSLQNQTKSEEEISRSDAKDLSDNQKAFKSDPARGENARKDLESLFK